MKLESLLILLAANSASRSTTPDRKTGQPPIIWRGNRVTLRGAIFGGDPAKEANLITDFSDVVSASLIIRKTNALGDVLVNKTLPVADLTTDLTFAQWQAGVGHFDFLLTGADTNHDTGTSGNLDIYFAIDLQTIDSDPITIATGTAQIREDGIGSAGSPTPGDPTYWTAAQADARYGALGRTTPDWRSDITGLTGGTATDLDSIATEDLAAGYLIALLISGTPHWYVLTAGTTAEASPGIIRPDDYATTTNEKIWTRIL